MHICFRPLFDDVSRINFRFRLLVTWSSPRGRGASSHIIYKDLNFFSFRLESAIHGPKISVLGGFYPQNLGAHRSDPQKALPWAERRVLSPHWSRSDAQCDLWPWQRKQKKKKKTVANWLFAQTTMSPYRSQSVHAEWPPVCSYIFQVSLKSV